MMYILALRGFLMVTFAAQRSKQFNSVSPSMSSNHGAVFRPPPPAHTPRAENQRRFISPEDRAGARETHIYYTWYMWLCGMNRPQQIGHILLRRWPVSEGSQLPRFLLQSGAKITEIPPSSPEHGQGAARKMSTL